MWLVYVMFGRLSPALSVLDCCVYLEQLLAVESGTIYKFAVVFEDPFPSWD